MSLDAKFVDEAVQRATDHCMDVVTHIVTQLVQDGVAYGDEPMNDDDFMLWYISLQRDGVLAHLPMIAPRYYERIRHHFERLATKHLIGTTNGQ